MMITVVEGEVNQLNITIYPLKREQTKSDKEEKMTLIECGNINFDLFVDGINYIL